MTNIHQPKKKPLISFGFSSYKNLELFEKKIFKLKKKGFTLLQYHLLILIFRKVQIEKVQIFFMVLLLIKNCIIGDGVTINSKTLIEHDTSIGSYSHISTGCVLNGGIRLEKKYLLAVHNH